MAAAGFNADCAAGERRCSRSPLTSDQLLTRAAAVAAVPGNQIVDLEGKYEVRVRLGCGRTVGRSLMFKPVEPLIEVDNSSPHFHELGLSDRLRCRALSVGQRRAYRSTEGH